MIEVFFEPYKDIIDRDLLARPTHCCAKKPQNLAFIPEQPTRITGRWLKRAGQGWSGICSSATVLSSPHDLAWTRRRVIMNTNQRAAPPDPILRSRPEPLLCSITDAAAALGLSRSKTYELISGGSLLTVSIGRRRLVRTDSIRALALGAAA
jgi:excisionase family DNA binding protein